MRLTTFTLVAAVYVGCAAPAASTPSANPPASAATPAGTTPPTPTPANALSITVSDTSVDVGGTLSFAANLAVTWSLVESGSGGRIDDHGTLSAPTTAGAFHVRATAGAQSVDTRIAVRPVVLSVTPNEAKPGELVTIAGAGFGTTPSQTSVTIGGLAAELRSWSPTAVMAVAPAAHGAVAVVVMSEMIPSRSSSLFLTWPVSPVDVSAFDAYTVAGVTGQDGAVIVGTENEGFFVQKLDGAGRAQWPTPDAPKMIAVETEVNASARMFSDGDGGAVVFYVGGTAAVTVFEQRVDRDGHLLAAPITALVGAADEGAWLATADGKGGFYLVLRVDGDSLAQHLDAAGQPMWGAGVRLGIGLDFINAIAASPSGGVLVAARHTASTPTSYLLAVASNGSVGSHENYVSGTSERETFYTIAGATLFSWLDAGGAITSVLGLSDTGTALWPAVSIDAADTVALVSASTAFLTDHAHARLRTLDVASGATASGTSGDEAVQGVAAAIVDPAGGFFLVFGPSQLQHYSPSGTPEWSTPPALHDGTSTSEQLIPDGVGGAVYLYFRYGDSHHPLEAQQITPLGTPTF